jgi:hypothetical protein
LTPKWSYEIFIPFFPYQLKAYIGLKSSKCICLLLKNFVYNFLTDFDVKINIPRREKESRFGASILLCSTNNTTTSIHKRGSCKKFYGIFQGKGQKNTMP